MRFVPVMNSISGGGGGGGAGGGAGGGSACCGSLCQPVGWYYDS